MAVRLSGNRPRRAVLLGVAAVAGGWILLRAVPTAIVWVREAQEALETRRGALERLQSDLAGLDAIGDTTKALQARVVALAPRILSGASAAEAENDLGGRVTLATNRGLVKLTGTVSVPDSAVRGALRRAGVRASFQGDIRGLVATLRGLERDPGALLLDDLRILAANPQEAENVPEVLRVELTVRGWYQAKKARP